jgi:hydroxypyruvate isomerase
MPRFAANLTLLFTELPFLDRFAAAREAGFAGVEVLFPYDENAQETRERLVLNGLTFVLQNTPPPNWTGGERGFAAVPGLKARFRKDFDRCLRFAEVLKPEVIHIMAGITDAPGARATFVENLTWAAARAPARQLTIEPLNPDDMPGYWLADFGLAAEILDQVAAPNLALQFDAYHAHRITGDVMGTWARHGSRAAHVQIAGVPGRHEPSGGEIDWPAFFARLDADGYRGWVSAEYHPKGATLDGLGWLG